MMEILEQALEAARTFTPLSEETVARLLARPADAAATPNTNSSRLQADTTERRTIHRAGLRPSSARSGFGRTPD
jgi:hypothetical protein